MPTVSCSSAPSRPSARRSDAGFVVVGTAVKLLLVLAIVAVTGYDALAIAGNAVGVEQDAQDAAVRANTMLDNGATPEQVYAATLAYAEQHGDTVVAKGFVLSDRHGVTVELRRQARTMVARYLPRVKDYTEAVASATSRDPA